MTIQILMPALSPTMEEGKLAKWNIKEGDTVAAGDIIAEIETDKATMEVEAVDEGTVGKIMVAEGAEGVKVNEVIAVLLEEGEDASAADAATRTIAADAAPAPASAEAPAPAAALAPAAPASAPVIAGGEVPFPLEPDWPANAPMKTQTVREALRDAMAEEMRRNDDVFLMGEEVAEYQGAYKISQGLLDEFGARRVIDTPDCRVHDLQLRHAGDRPDHQLGGKDAVYVGRADGVPHRVSRRQWCCGPRRCPAQPRLRRLVRPGPRPEGGPALFGGGCQGPAEIRDPRPQSGDLPGE
jgi:hypothetical protein